MFLQLPHSITKRTQPALTLVWGACVATLCGCNTSTTTSETLPARNVAASAMTAQQRPGLDTMWWHVREWNGESPTSQYSVSIAATLQPYLLTHENVSDPALVDVLETWRANGLFVSLVPGEQLSDVLRALTPVGQIERLVVAPTDAWTAIGKSARYNDDTPIMLDNGAMRLPRGHLRLLLRGWAEPIAVDSQRGLLPAIHIELVPQAFDAQNQSSLRRLALNEQMMRENADNRRRVRGQGQVFSRLTLEALVKPGHALLITADDTAAYWPAPEELAALAHSTPNENADETSDEDRESTPAEIEQMNLGPRAVPWPEGVDAPTLGQQLLNQRIEYTLAPGTDPTTVFGQRTGHDRLRVTERGVILIAPTGLELFGRR